MRGTSELRWKFSSVCVFSHKVLSGSRSTRAEDSVMANPAVRMAYKRMSGLSGAEAAAEAASADGGGRPIEGDCPICYDDLSPGGETPKVHMQPSCTTS
jgi:hypothetical protein